MTMDGQINANFITTGQMNVARIKGLTDNLNKINTAIELNSNNIQSVVEESGKLSSRISQNTSSIQLKLDSSKFTSSAVIGLINNRDGTSTAKINATNINLNGVVTANNYFKINLDGSMEATAGRIAGINIGNTGLFYSGAASNDGFGLWKNGVHSSDGSYIIFHAGANAGNIAGAGFKVYQNGAVHATNMVIEGNFSEGHGLCIKGNPSFFDFYANSNTVTTRLIDYGSQFLFAGNKSFSFVNISNSTYESIQAESLYINGTDCRIWTSGHELLLSCGSNVSVVNKNNSAYMPIISSNFVTSSSRRYKENIVDMTEEECLKILEVAVKTFDYKSDSRMRGIGVTGVIAEEIVKVIPNCVSSREIDGKVVPDGVDYSKLVPYLIKGMQIIYEKLIRLESK